MKSSVSEVALTDLLRDRYRHRYGLTDAEYDAEPYIRIQAFAVIMEQDALIEKARQDKMARAARMGKRGR